MPLCHVSEDRISDYLTAGERAVGCEDNPASRAFGQEVLLVEIHVILDLIHRYGCFRDLFRFGDMAHREIADAYVSDLPRIDQTAHRVERLVHRVG